MSGVRSVEITSPGSRTISRHTNEISYYPSIIGSRNLVNVWIETSCCHKGVEITVYDLKGQMIRCVAGINPNSANSIILSSTFSNILLICALFQVQEMLKSTVFYNAPTLEMVVK